MGNCFNQDESQYSSLKTMKKVESVLNQPIHENESGKICLKDFLVKQAGLLIQIVQIGLILQSFEGENEMQLKRICYESYKKADIIKYGLINHTMLEKNVLEYSNNPFVIKLQYSFQIEQKLYLVMELVNGGELLRVITKQPQKHFSFNQTQFCAAQVVLGLEYIHEKLKVIQRVQNQKIFQQQNFGLSKQYESLDMKFFTIVGTPEYLAPEILNNSGHNQTVDWWCLGILIYEKLVSKTPFKDYENNFLKYRKTNKRRSYLIS
ncbi:unnamed protein product [Paramecium sonneborni]|uniref:Protein kinase domain-containing protein n=1 Tax=Paramecium sonneborni TaxID=65129 RepID=A0A8S1MF68_9CILI|nr:unnamed protein product [Paramecium sonneborni]